MSRSIPQHTRRIAQEPSHTMTDPGIVPLAQTFDLPADTYRWLEECPPLMTGIEWSGLALSERMEIMISWGQPRSAILTADVFDAFPANSRDYLAFWQREINTGACWRGAGFLGRNAMNLLSSGFCLCGVDRALNSWNENVPSRSDVNPGGAGSAAFVQAIMGARYLAWIGDIR